MVLENIFGDKLLTSICFRPRLLNFGKTSSCMHAQCGRLLNYTTIINDMSDYINLFLRIAHIICNHSVYYKNIPRDLYSIDILETYVQTYISLTS
jgi:hypothetical protein